MRMMWLTIVVAAACGGSSTSPESAKPTMWKSMNLDQRMTYMKDVVLPEAKTIFTAFDPKYQTMDCVTCHGDGVTNGDYEMPNAKIKPLPSTEEAFIAWISKDAEAARYTKFMSEELEPLMGKLLDKTIFDPKTKTGELGCTTCHTLTGGEPAKP